MIKPMSRGLSFPAHKWMDALQRFSRDSSEIARDSSTTSIRYQNRPATHQINAQLRGEGNHRRRRRHRHLSPGGDTIVRFPLPCGPLTWRGGKWRHLSASVCTGTDKPTKSFPVNLEVDLEVDFSCRNESRCRCRYFQQPNGSQ